MRNTQQIIDSIFSDMKESFTEARKYKRKGNKTMSDAAFKYARECRDQLYEFMTTEEARQLYIKAYEEIFEKR